MMIWELNNQFFLVFATKQFQEKNPKPTTVVDKQITEALENLLIIFWLEFTSSIANR